jgi:hypothetical protein
MSVARTFAQRLRKSVRDTRYRRRHHDEITQKRRARRASEAKC